MVVKILVVDDHLENQKEMKQILERSSHYLPFIVLTASNGDDALALYRENSEIEGAILDTILDAGGNFGERGWEVYDRLREAGYKGPVIARSSTDSDQGWGDHRPRVTLSKSARLSELEALVARSIASGYRVQNCDAPKEIKQGSEILVVYTEGGILHGTFHGYNSTPPGTLHIAQHVAIPLHLSPNFFSQEERPHPLTQERFAETLAYVRRDDPLFPRRDTTPQAVTMYGFGNRFDVYTVLKQ